MNIKLNLIPDYRKEEIVKQEKIRSAIRNGFYLALVFGVFFLALLGFNYSLRSELNSISHLTVTGSGKSGYEKVLRYDDEFRSMNSHFLKIKKIQDANVFWSQILIRMGNDFSDRVSLSELSTKGLKINILGKAVSRDDLLKLKESLEADECFSEISLPLSDLVDKENVDFQMDFSIKDDCIKNK